MKALAGNKVTHGLEVLVDLEGLEVLVDLLSWGSKGSCRSCEGLNSLAGLAQGGKRGNKKVSKVIYSSDIFRKQESQ